MENNVAFELYLVRHAQSFGNVSEKCPFEYEPDDPPLTDTGLNQAQRLGFKMKDIQLDAIIASTLTRTIQTAYGVATQQKNPVSIELLPDLMEVGTKISGCPIEVVKENFPLAIPCLKEPTAANGKLTLGEENHQIMQDRGNRVIKYLSDRFTNGEKVLVVSHGGFFGYLLRAALGLGDTDKFCWQVLNCGVTKIRFLKDGLPVLLFSNNLSHLEDSEY